MEQNFVNVNPRDYYQSLSRKEKGKFLLYLAKKYGYPPSTMSAKLRENYITLIRDNELKDLQKAINSGVWNQ